MISKRNGYEGIDPIIEKWAKDNKLFVYKEYRDLEVRSVDVRSDLRTGYQIWIDAPDPDGLIGIHVWNFRKPKRGGKQRDFLVSFVDLEEYLANALIIATHWVNEK